MDPLQDAPKIKSIVDRLCDEYKSHQYPLPRKEAKVIGLPVVNADLALEALLTDVLKFYLARPLAQLTPAPKPGQQLKTQIAWLDSLRSKFRCEARRELTKVN
jgi:hypothetical protein